MSEPASPPATEEPSAKRKEPSSVRRTPAIQRDRSKRPLVQPSDEEITARLTALVHPLAYARAGHFYALGLRQRTLTLPVVLALVLSMIWRQIGSVRSAVLLLEREGFLWTGPIRASHQALNQRLRSSLPSRRRPGRCRATHCGARSYLYKRQGESYPRQRFARPGAVQMPGRGGNLACGPDSGT